MKITPQAIIGQIATLATHDVDLNEPKITALLSLLKAVNPGQVTVPFANNIDGLSFKDAKITDPDLLEESADKYIERTQVSLMSDMIKILSQEKALVGHTDPSRLALIMDNLARERSETVQRLADVGGSVMDRKISVSFGSKEKMMAAIDSFENDLDISSNSDIRRDRSDFPDNPFTIDVWCPSNKRDEILNLVNSFNEYDPSDDYTPGINSIKAITPLIPGLKDEIDRVRMTDMKKERQTEENSISM